MTQQKNQDIEAITGQLTAVLRAEGFTFGRWRYEADEGNCNPYHPDKRPIDAIRLGLQFDLDRIPRHPYAQMMLVHDFAIEPGIDGFVNLPRGLKRATHKVGLLIPTILSEDYIEFFVKPGGEYTVAHLPDNLKFTPVPYPRPKNYLIVARLLVTNFVMEAENHQMGEKR